MKRGSGESTSGETLQADSLHSSNNSNFVGAKQAFQRFLNGVSTLHIDLIFAFSVPLIYFQFAFVQTEGISIYARYACSGSTCKCLWICPEGRAEVCV